VIVGMIVCDEKFFKDESLPIEFICHARIGSESGLYGSFGYNGANLSKTAGGLSEVGIGYCFNTDLKMRIWAGNGEDSYTKTLPLIKFSMNVLRFSEVTASCGIGRDKFISSFSMAFKQTIVF